MQTNKTMDDRHLFSLSTIGHDLFLCQKSEFAAYHPGFGVTVNIGIPTHLTSSKCIHLIVIFFIKKF